MKEVTEDEELRHVYYYVHSSKLGTGLNQPRLPYLALLHLEVLTCPSTDANTTSVIVWTEPVRDPNHSWRKANGPDSNSHLVTTVTTYVADLNSC